MPEKVRFGKVIDIQKKHGWIEFEIMSELWIFECQSDSRRVADLTTRYQCGTPVVCVMLPDRVVFVSPTDEMLEGRARITCYHGKLNAFAKAVDTEHLLYIFGDRLLDLTDMDDIRNVVDYREQFVGFTFPFNLDNFIPKRFTLLLKLHNFILKQLVDDQFNEFAYRAIPQATYHRYRIIQMKKLPSSASGNPGNMMLAKGGKSQESSVKTVKDGHKSFDIETVSLDSSMVNDALKTYSCGRLLNHADTGSQTDSELQALFVQQSRELIIAEGLVSLVNYKYPELGALLFPP